jgi:hypothetical protein
VKKVKKCVVLQVNDAAVSLRLVVVVSKVQLFYIQITDTDGGGERGEECHPSDLLCWLTVIWSGAPTDSLGGGPQCRFGGLNCNVKSGCTLLAE